MELFRGYASQQFFALKGALDLWSLLPAAAGVLRTKGEAAKPSGRNRARDYRILCTKGKAAEPSEGFLLLSTSELTLNYKL